MLKISDVQDALKEFYLPGLRFQLNDKASIFLAQLERDSDSVEGKYCILAMRYGRQGGIGMRDDDGTLPTASSRKTKQAKWETKNVFGRIQITDKTIKASRSNVGAFAQLLETELKDNETDIKQDISRQCLGDGGGALATISSTKTGSTAPVDSVTFLSEGMRVDIYDTSATAWLNQDVTVDVVNDNVDPPTVTFSAIGTCADGDVIYVAGSKDKELTGVKAVMENASLYNITRTEHPWLYAKRTNINGQISEVAIQKAIDESEVRAGGEINFLMGSHGVRRAYFNLLTAKKQFVNTLELKGGWKALSFNGVAFAADRYVSTGKLFCFDLSNWKLIHMGDWEWMDDDGAMLNRVANKAAYEATLLRYMDIGCDKPRAQHELYGITEA